MNLKLNLRPVFTGLVLFALTPKVAFAAQTIGDLANHWIGQLGPLAGFVTALCYGFAIFFAFIGGNMLYHKNKDQSAADPQAGKRILASFAAAVILVAIPEALGTGVMSVFGSTSNLSNIDGNVPQIR